MRCTRREVTGGLIAAAIARPAFGAGAGPTYLNAHAGAWDRRRGVALIFGGADERQVLNTLWQLRGGHWRLLSRSGPRPRTFTSLAYDERRDRLVVFGGNSVLFGRGGDTVLDDHWEWDGRRWSRFEGLRPPGRTAASCAFDPVRNRTLLFGGWRFESGERIRLDDLWGFDGRAWVRLAATGPQARSGAAMTWDPEGRRLLMGGGNGPKGDFWAFDGSTWSRLADLPQPRFNPALGFDRRGGQALLFGGWTGEERIAATALFDGRRWHPHAGREPPPRNHTLLVPIEDGSRLLLLGGHDGENVFGDQWEWAGRWVPRALRPRRPRVDNGH